MTALLFQVHCPWDLLLKNKRPRSGPEGSILHHWIWDVFNTIIVTSTVDVSTYTSSYWHQTF